MIIRYAGLDISPNHAGLVILNEAGLLGRFYFVGKTKKECNLRSGAPGEGVPYPSELAPKTMPDQGQRTVYRLGWMREWLLGVMSDIARRSPGADLYVAIENYAFAAEQGAHQIGEVGGMARLLLLLETSAKFRLHDPMTVKLYVTGKGNADKDAVRQAVRQQAGLDFEAWGVSPKTAEDLYDATAIAQLVRDEHLLRTGRLQLRDLPEHKIRVFNRVTDSSPVNILAREWIVGLSDDQF